MSEWPSVRADKAFSILLGRQRSPARATGLNMTPYLRSANVGDGRLDLRDVKEMDFSPAERERFGLRRGDVLVSEGSASANAVGMASAWHDDLPGDVCFQNTLLRFRAIPGVSDPGFVLQWCRWAYESGAFRDTASGTNIKHIGSTRAAAMPVALPPIDEQHRIVGVLSGVDAQVDALVEEVARADRLWWSLGSAMIEALAETPSVRLDEIADISGGLTKNKKDFDQPDLVEVPYLRVANVHRRYLDLRVVATIQTTAAKAEALRLLPGDVLFNEGGDKDKLGRGDVWRGQVDGCIHQNHVFRARVTDAGFDPRFVSAWGNTFGKTWFETFGTQTTGIASINKRTLSRFPIPNVERAVQSRWADLLGDAVSTHDAGQAELVRLRAFRSSLLTALLAQDVEIAGSYDKLLEAAS